MAFGGHTFLPDVGVGSYSWSDVLCFWDKLISCSKTGLFETKTEKSLHERL
jgi:hypothetical protein